MMTKATNGGGSQIENDIMNSLVCWYDVDKQNIQNGSSVSGLTNFAEKNSGSIAYLYDDGSRTTAVVNNGDVLRYGTNATSLTPEYYEEMSGVYITSSFGSDTYIYAGPNCTSENLAVDEPYIGTYGSIPNYKMTARITEIRNLSGNTIPNNITISLTCDNSFIRPYVHVYADGVEVCVDKDIDVLEYAGQYSNIETYIDVQCFYEYEEQYDITELSCNISIGLGCDDFLHYLVLNNESYTSYFFQETIPQEISNYTLIVDKYKFSNISENNGPFCSLFNRSNAIYYPEDEQLQFKFDFDINDQVIVAYNTRNDGKSTVYEYYDNGSNIQIMSNNRYISGDNQYEFDYSNMIYDSKFIIGGTASNGVDFNVFAQSIAFRTILLFDRELTDEEIDWVKLNMLHNE